MYDELIKIYNSSPYPELVVRKGYNIIPQKLKQEMTHKKIKKGIYIDDQNKINPDDFFSNLKANGISQGDLLIVHSSMDMIRRIECNENELLDRLIDLVGKEGTIALPAFPDEAKLKMVGNYKVYDPQRSIAWTGMLPNLLLRRKNAIRSAFPHNPLVSFGAKSEAMMKNNLDVEYAHGKGSCWGFCVENHAKVIFLGIPTFHSNTILHTAEDYQPGFWPDYWYENKEYLVKNENTMKPIKARIRSAKWSSYLAEQYTEQKYIRAGLIRQTDYHNIHVSLIDDSFKLIDSIMKEWEKLKFFYIPRRK